MSDTNTIILIFASYLISMLIYWFLLKQSKHYTLRKANVSAIRFSSQTKPVSGGIGFFIMSIITAIFFLYLLKDKAILSQQHITIGLALTIAFFAGLLDDIHNTPPTVKLFSQLIVSVICIYSGIYIHLTDNNTINFIFTALWIIGIMNSINMLDNMDAIASVTALTIILSLTANNYFGAFSLPEHLFLLIIFFTILSFLFFNWNPSKMYMGDSGSQFIGAVLAIFAILFIWNPNLAMPSGNSTLRAFGVVFIAFLIPITDTFSVTLNRIMKGKSPFIGGRDHTTHHLFYRGLSEKSIAILFLFISLMTNFTAVIITTDTISILHPISITVLIISLLYFILAYINSRTSKNGSNEKSD